MVILYFLEYISAEGFKGDSALDATNSTTFYGMDDSSDKIEIIDEPPRKVSSDETERSAALFIVHGAPTTGNLFRIYIRVEPI